MRRRGRERDGFGAGTDVGEGDGGVWELTILGHRMKNEWMGLRGGRLRGVQVVV